MLSEVDFEVLKIGIYFALLILILMIAQISARRHKRTRILSHALRTKQADEINFGDVTLMLLHKLAHLISKKLLKFKFSRNAAKKKNKYLVLFHDKKMQSMDFISYKIIIMIILLFIVSFGHLLLNEAISILDVIMIILVSNLLVEGYLRIKFAVRTRRLRTQLLDAIILMNNAYKSGKSTVQALENTYMELDEEMGSEFRIVHNDISKGLSIDEAFHRFAKRTDLKEIDYIASTISVMTATGGNIVVVFDRILKAFYARKKVAGVVAAKTATAKFTCVLLILITPVIIMGIAMTDPNYFRPLFTEDSGRLLLTIICILYLCYIIVANRILRGVRIW